jgi:hypothetical protein
MTFRKPTEGDRVRRYSSRRQLERIDERTRRHIRLYANQPPAIIEQRIAELRSEWSIERFLQLNAAAVGLTSLALALTRNQRWGYVTCAALAFFFIHATDGFDPPLPLLRQFGVRTRLEIDREIYALKALRGDFDQIDPLDGDGEAVSVSRASAAVGV